MKVARWVRKAFLASVVAALIVTAVSLGDQKTDPPAARVLAASVEKLPRIWVSQTTKHEFRVTVDKDLFRAEWINVPPAAAKQGAYIRSECRRSGSKWIGTSSIYQPFAVPGQPPGKDLTTCHLTLRFEVDSISPQKITGRGETLKGFDVGKCQVLQTGWGNFVWVPKKR